MPHPLLFGASYVMMAPMNQNIARNIIATAVILLSLAACASSQQAAKADTATNADSAGNLIIFYDPAVGKDELREAAKKYGSEVIYEYKNFNSIAVTVPQGKTMEEAIRFYEKTSGVLSVMEDRKMELH